MARIKQARADAIVPIYEPERMIPHPAQVVATEELGADIGLLRLNFADFAEQWFKRLPWRRSVVQTFESVRARGYPYGLYEINDTRYILQRGFQGHQVSHLLNYLPVGMTGIPFGAYELSFGAPRGLSGAALMTCEDSPLATGIIIGNAQARMLVFQSEEVDSENGTKHTVEHYESMSLGIAVAASTIFGLQSSLLGSTIGEFLEATGMIR